MFVNGKWDSDQKLWTMAVFKAHERPARAGEGSVVTEEHRG